MASRDITGTILPPRLNHSVGAVPVAGNDIPKIDARQLSQQSTE